MGQKISPTGFRLAVNKNFASKWYANSKNFPIMLLEDIKVRTYLKKKLAGASVGKVVIERPTKNAKITIYCTAAVQILTDATVVSTGTTGTKGVFVGALTNFPTSVTLRLSVVSTRESAVIAIIGISQTHATEKSVLDRVKETAKSINKEVNKPVNPKPCPPIAVRG